MDGASGKEEQDDFDHRVDESIFLVAVCSSHCCDVVDKKTRCWYKVAGSCKNPTREREKLSCRQTRGEL
jgi:hypothetical protein